MPDSDDETRRRQRSDAALNAARLLEVARHRLAADPGASMAALAEEAGVSRGTLYRHFSSREVLVEAVRAQARDDAEASEADYLRPPGELAHVAPTPLSVADVLNKVPPHQLADQVVAEAQRSPGVSSAAVYLVDLDGADMQRMAGAAAFPERIPVPLAVGPEIPREGVAPLRAAVEELLPGSDVAPLYLRGRAIGVLLVVGEGDDALRDLALEAAAAIELADVYTDVMEMTRRVRPTTPAAEIQQNLLPPRIVRIAGASLAGNVLPGYDIGGDWFDYAENGDCAWVGIADAEGTGPRAAGLASVLLGAFRAARHHGDDPAEAVALMHEVLDAVAAERSTATATIGCWNAPAALFRWVACGEVAPMLIHADGRLELLEEGLVPRLGDPAMPRRATVQARRLEVGQRLLLLSDGILGRPTTDGGTLGVHGVHRAALKAHSTTAAGTVRAIEDAVRETVVDALDDDATLVVFVPTDPATADRS
ncbi:MAG: Serine phosphatase RsbU, regulator of sigma subunit [uncultured Solirubrobacteraceae bacterium]|uniref:Serine phosphatase RsbU, regulator of sigma subunit n=1 Tax=uncultured Solirubrobacteraceae bacterium TaxID=1162706 RepID=A0A6J4RQK2_9ACTN|nr:MAG: Serine phosphatase RsbU, regulator of sigma subunit [uncultured Solirubrobacteraceae bacterium]